MAKAIKGSRTIRLSHVRALLLTLILVMIMGRTSSAPQWGTLGGNSVLIMGRTSSAPQWGTLGGNSVLIRITTPTPKCATPGGKLVLIPIMTSTPGGRGKLVLVPNMTSAPGSCGKSVAAPITIPTPKWETPGGHSIRTQAASQCFSLFFRCTQQPSKPNSILLLDSHLFAKPCATANGGSQRLPSQRAFFLWSSQHLPKPCSTDHDGSQRLSSQGAFFQGCSQPLPKPCATDHDGSQRLSSQGALFQGCSQLLSKFRATALGVPQLSSKCSTPHCWLLSQLHTPGAEPWTKLKDTQQLSEFRATAHGVPQLSSKCSTLYRWLLSQLHTPGREPWTKLEDAQQLSHLSSFPPLSPQLVSWLGATLFCLATYLVYKTSKWKRKSRLLIFIGHMTLPSVDPLCARPKWRQKSRFRPHVGTVLKTQPKWGTLFLSKLHATIHSGVRRLKDRMKQTLEPPTLPQVCAAILQGPGYLGLIAYLAYSTSLCLSYTLSKLFTTIHSGAKQLSNWGSKAKQVSTKQLSKLGSKIRIMVLKRIGCVYGAFLVTRLVLGTIGVLSLLRLQQLVIHS